MAVFVQLNPFIGSSSAILQPIDLSIAYMMYLNTINHIKKRIHDRIIIFVASRTI